MGNDPLYDKKEKNYNIDIYHLLFFYKEQMKFAKKISVNRTAIITHGRDFNVVIQDGERVKELVNILLNCSIPPKDMAYTGSGTDRYHLTLLNEKDQLIATIDIENLPFKMKLKGYSYQFILEPKI